MNIEHKYLEILKYLKACNIRIAQKETQKNFQLRSRVSDVRINVKGKYESLEYAAYQENEEESQKHVINCKPIKIFEMSQNMKKYIMEIQK